MSDLFRFKLEVPMEDHEFMGGKIVLDFLHPRMYFGFDPDTFALRNLSPQEQRERAFHHASRQFTGIIEKELREAVKSAERQANIKILPKWRPTREKD